MGEPTCLIQHQPFSYVAGLPNDSNQGNTLDSIAQSICFGRFVSETLAWDKWSTFSHNRYVEEAERFSKPGSVAQKKAFFEAHYKNLAARKAAALLEQAANANSPEQVEAQVAYPTQQHSVDDDIRGMDDTEEERFVRYCYNNGEKEQVQTQSQSQEEIEEATPYNKDLKMEKPLLKDFMSGRDDLLPSTSCSKKNSSKSLFSSSSSSSRPPSKQLPCSPAARKGYNYSTPISTKKPAIDRRRRLTPKSNCTPRAKTPLQPGSKSIRPKWHFLPTDSCSKFMSSSRNKSPSSNLSTPFKLRTEDRATRRKEKLEEKFNSNQAQKAQLQTTLKEKAEAELKKLRQSLCFKARPLPKFYKETRTNEMGKVPLTHQRSSQPTAQRSSLKNGMRRRNKENISP